MKQTKFSPILSTFGVLILCGFVFIPSFAQEFTDAIVVMTDKNSYDDGETIIISGLVRERLSGYDVNVQIIAANGNLVTSQQIPVSNDNTFRLDLLTGGPLWRSAGTYTVQVLYGTATRTAETTFEFSGSGDVIPPTSNEEILVESTDDGSIFVILSPIGIDSHRRLSLELSFEDADDNPIEHMNFEITAIQDGNEVLAETNQHVHSGVTEFTTAEMNFDSPLDVQVTILGIGLPNDDPDTWTGSRDETLSLRLVDFDIQDESEEVPDTDLPDSEYVSIPAGAATPGCEETNECYIESEVEIAVGGEVVWSNDDSASHTVTSGNPKNGPDGNFDSGLFLSGQTFTHRFDEQGEFPYFCLVHPWMTGTVFVGQGIPNPNPIPTPPPDTNLPYDVTVIMAKGTASNQNCGDQCYMPNTVSVAAGGKVTWNNVDSAAHTATATDGSFDTSLVNANASGSITFNTAGSYPYMCILHPWMKGTVFVGQGVPNPTPNPDIEFFITVDDSEYDLGEVATLSTHISGISSSQNVAITVTDPFGTVMVSRTLTTDSSGNANADFKIAESFKTGTYRIDATSSINGETYSDTLDFKVVSQFNQIQIISAQGTDQQGNPMEFSRGSMGFVKVQVNAQKPIATLITVNVFDSDLTPLGVGSLKTTLNTGQSELILSFMIPQDAVVGTADIYVNALSDWVSAGGIPQTGEFAGQVRIN